MQIMRCEHLSKIYGNGEGQVYALNDVTLSLESSTFTAITGPSGSGKSTLLHMLSGLDKPTKGDVWYQDAKLSAYCTGISGRCWSCLPSRAFPSPSWATPST